MYKEKNQLLDAMGIEFPDFESMTNEEKGLYAVARFPDELLNYMTDEEKKTHHINRSTEELLYDCKFLYISVDLQKPQSSLL